MDFMAHSGKYIVKIPSKYKGDHTKVVYRSMWERNAFVWCENSSEVKEWSSEEVVIPYYYDVDKKYHRYFMDLKITYTNGRTVLVEIKPAKETQPPKRPDKSKRYLNEAFTYIKNQNKWKAAAEYAKDRGWEFDIWTEHKLEAMGINPKPLKSLKKIAPLKPLRKPKKKK
jgi:hypothetical protein